MNHYIDDNFLDEKTYKELIKYKELHKKDASGYYDDLFYEIIEDSYSKLLSIIENNFNEEMNIDYSIIRRYTTMEQKNGMKWHLDNINSGRKILEQRKFTGSIVLNKNFVGGQFKFKVDEKITTISPRPGQLVLIRSDVLHGVEDIVIGTRYCLLIWVRVDYIGDVRETHHTPSG